MIPAGISCLDSIPGGGIPGGRRWKDFDITLCGTPGHARFDPRIPSLLHHAIGVVAVIDAAKPDTFARARKLIAHLANHRMPILIAANEQDLPGTTDEKAIRSILGVTEETPVFFISALQKADAHCVQKSMVDHITQFSYGL